MTAIPKLFGLGQKYSSDVYHHDRWKLTWGCTTFEMLGIEFCVNLAEIVTLNFLKLDACFKKSCGGQNFKL